MCEGEGEKEDVWYGREGSKKRKKDRKVREERGRMM